ncbi:alpha/beta hydrolase [Nonomuraea thailandensis]
MLAHGFTGSWRDRTVRRIVHVLSGYGGVIAFDFRGHGRSGGETTVGDLEILDVQAAVRHARVAGYSKIAVVGFSMGAAVAVRHAGLRGRVNGGVDGGADGRVDGRVDGGVDGRVDAVVAVSGPARWYYRGTKPMRRVHWAIEQPFGRWAARVAKRTRIARGEWDPIPMPPHEAAGLISPAPLLIVHGDADTFFPLDHARQLYDGAREPKELWIEPGFGHAEAAATPELVRRIGKWISSNFS